MRIFVFVFSIILPFCHVVAQDVIVLKRSAVSHEELSEIPCKNIEQIENGYVVTYTFDKATVIADQLYNGCVMWKYAGFGTDDTPTLPALPYRNDCFAVPNGYSAQVELLDSSWVDLNYSLSPARPPLTDSGNEVYTKKNVPEISAYGGYFPHSVIASDKSQMYRGNEIVNIKVSPVKYNVEDNIVRAFTSLKYLVRFVENADNASAGIADAGAAISNDIFLSNTTLNAESGTACSDSSANKGYLILSTPKFSEAVERFSKWKTLLGYDVKAVIRTNWTEETIKKTVEDIYHENSDLYYLLIIGDHEDVPSQDSPTGFFPHVTDFYYSCMDGDSDATPDLLCGRLPVLSLDEANVVIDKIIKYEKSPVSDSLFYKRGVNCAYFQDNKCSGYEERRFTLTSEEIRAALVREGYDVERVYAANENVSPKYWNNTYFSYGEQIPLELQKPNFAWNGNAKDINEAVNEGALFVFHRDHGDVGAWGSPYYTAEHISSLTNGDKTPVVFSINCLTGKFISNSFCESFLKKGNGGCVAIFGASETNYSGHNDVLAEGMFDAIWPSELLRPNFPEVSGQGGKTPIPTYELGQILNQGKARMAEMYGNGVYTTYTKEIFHCFGDPSMKIYTEQPKPFRNVTLSENDDNISISLNGERATITFVDLLTGESESLYAETASFKTAHKENISVCVSGHNRIPYLVEGITPSTVYIQNETLSGTKSFSADTIRIGSSVTQFKEEGLVTFEKGDCKLEAGKIVIRSETKINTDANLKIYNK